MEHLEAAALGRGPPARRLHGVDRPLHLLGIRPDLLLRLLLARLVASSTPRSIVPSNNDQGRLTLLKHLAHLSLLSLCPSRCWPTRGGPAPQSNDDHHNLGGEDFLEPSPPTVASSAHG